MKKLIVLLFVLIFNENLFSQFAYSWVKALTNSGMVGSRIRGIETSSNGNVYIIGNFNTTTDFDPSSASYFLSPNISKSCFLAKYAANGNFIWAKEILAETGTGSNTIDVNDLVIDPNENIYITGAYDKTVDFDPSMTTFTLSSNSQIIYTAKYNSSGNLVWVKDIKRPYYNGGQTIALDNNNNIYIGGNLINCSFFCKYNNAGTMLWKDSLNSTANGDNFFKSMHVNAIGEVFIGGDFYTDVDMDPGNGISQLNAANAFYMGKYTTNGTLVWAKKLNRNLPGDDYMIDITTDALSNIYTCGIGSSGTDYKNLMMKWDVNGNLQWMNYFGDALLGWSGSFDITVACNNNIIVSGLTDFNMSASQNYDPLGGTYTCSPSPNNSFDIGTFAFVASYSSSNGAINWAKSLGGPIMNSAYVGFPGGGSSFYLSNSFIDNNGAVYLCGRISDNASSSGGTNDFDPSPASTATLNLTTDKAFFAKYTGCGAVGIEEYNTLSKIKLSPNPSSDKFTFSGLVGENTIEVYDVSGRLILNEHTTTDSYQINLSAYNSGIYFYKIKDKYNNTQQGKLLLQ
jgi:uncharacterized protein (DUF2249 family)